MRKTTKNLVIGILVGALGSLFLAIPVGLYCCKSGLLDTFMTKSTPLSDESEIITVYQFKEGYSKNQEFRPDMVFETKVKGQLACESYIADLNAVKDLVFDEDVVKGAILSKQMVVDKKVIALDSRLFELKNLVLPQTINNEQVIDVRISFPTGQDYVVLSHKTIEEVKIPQNETAENSEILILKLSPEEILLVSSAMVDKFMYAGTYLYATVYLDAEAQRPSRVTYPENEAVHNLINQDPNISKDHDQVELQTALSEFRKDLQDELQKYAKVINAPLAGDIGHSEVEYGPYTDLDANPIIPPSLDDVD